jgi:hypothetical protein
MWLIGNRGTEGGWIEGKSNRDRDRETVRLDGNIQFVN